MSKNKKIIILITISVIAILSIIGISMYQNTKVYKEVKGNNKEKQMQENVIQKDTIDDKKNTENIEKENDIIKDNNGKAKMQDTVIEKKNESTEKVKEKTNKNIVKNETTQKQKDKENNTKSTTPIVQKNDTQLSTKKQENKVTTGKQQVIETKKTIKNSNEEKVEEHTNSKTKCNHIGENWFDTNEQAEAKVDEVFKKWNDKYKRGEITWEQLGISCPIGYEIFKCHCGKHFLQFSYEQ